jgi:hypothetical protein
VGDFSFTWGLVQPQVARLLRNGELTSRARFGSRVGPASRVLPSGTLCQPAYVPLGKSGTYCIIAHFCAKIKPGRPCPSGQSGPVVFGRNRISQRVIRLDLASLSKVSGPWGQGGGGSLFLAGPRRNFKGAKELGFALQPGGRRNAFAMRSSRSA